MLYAIPAYEMLASFIGVYRHFQQCVRYNVYHGDQFYHHVIRYTRHIVESVIKHQ
jgi:hypothetical protein